MSIEQSSLCGTGAIKAKNNVRLQSSERRRKVVKKSLPGHTIVLFFML